MLLEMMGEDTSISSTSVQPDIDIFMRQDAIIWQFYSHGFASPYGFVEDFRRASTVQPSSSIWVLMEGELGAEIDFVSDNADHHQITIGHNTACMHSGSDARRQDP